MKVVDDLNLVNVFNEFLLELVVAELFNEIFESIIPDSKV